MLSNGVEDGLEGADLERIMVRDRDVEFATCLSRQSHVRSGLATLDVPESGQGLGEVLAADVAWEPYRDSTSSRT